VATRILELERGEIRSYTGNYDQYHDEKILVREQQIREYENQQERLRKEQVFIDKFRYKATKARAVQSRIKRLDKIEVIDAPEAERASVSFGLGEVTRSGAIVLEAKEMTMGYDGLTLYKDVNFQVFRGERVGIIGPNGAGKSTLLRQIAGHHPGITGEVTLGNKVKVGYYDQNHEDLNPDADVLTEVHAARPLWKPEQVRSFLGRFLFTGDDVFKTIRTLSGGEMSRVAMARMILSEANLLLLDEPTNHLDIVSREALEQALQEFPGTIVIISHDRELIDRLVDKLVIIEDGKSSIFLGNYTAYREKLARDSKPDDAELKTEDVLKIRRGKEEKKEKPAKKEVGKKEPVISDARKRQREQEALEKQIEALENIVHEYEEGFAHILPTDFAVLEAHTKQYEAYKADLQGLYQQWESLVG
jgi:ATP-binding cassette subfamily F protein 3